MQIIAFHLDEAGPRRLYDALFDRCPAAFLQQSTLWAEVIAELGPDTPLFLLALCDGEPIAGLPLYLYEHRLGNVLTSVPQAGPLGGVFHLPDLAPSTREDCFRALLAEAMAQARRHRCVALSIITNPFADDLPQYQRHFAPDYLLENFTQVIDLGTFFGSNGEVRLPDYHRHSNLRRNLDKGRRAALTARCNLRPGELDRLYELHRRRHAEIGAAPLDPRLLRNIAAILVPRRKATFIVVEAAGSVVSWGLYLHHERVMDVLRLNLDSAAMAVGPNFYNTNISLALARDLGVTHYHWQSSPSRESGIYRYKQQWGAREAVYYYATRLLCPVDYLRQLGLATIQTEYPLHFLVPYLAAANGFAPGRYRKGDNRDPAKIFSPGSESPPMLG